MSMITRRRATKEDIAAFAAKMPDVAVIPTAKAWIGELDGRAIALGGIAFAHGRWIGFLDVTEEGRELLKKNMHVRVEMLRAIMLALREFKEQGVRYIYANADMNYARADEMLEKFGFSIDPRSQQLYRWSNTQWQG